MADTNFMFATGIENSDPTINNGKKRMDEMEKCDHYNRWKEDFSLLEEMGIKFLRYGVPLHKTFTAHGKYDWSFCDIVFKDLRKRKIIPIVDLCHFGVPDWIGNFPNPGGFQISLHNVEKPFFDCLRFDKTS